MARGAGVIGSTREEAIGTIEAEGLRVVDCVEIELGDIELQASAVPRMWVVVIEDDDPTKIEQDDDPIAKVTHQVRTMFLAMQRGSDVK